MAVLGSSTNPGNAQTLKETELAAEAFGVQLQYLDVRDPKDIENGIPSRSKGHADAVLVLGGPSSLLSEHTLRSSRQRAGSRRYTTERIISKLVA